MIMGMVLLASCDHGSETRSLADDEPALDTVVFNDLGRTLESPKIRNYSFVPLETNEDCLISEISALRCHGDRFYILDKYAAQKVFVFDSKGKFLYKIDKTGRGYGEYVEPNSFDVDSGGRVYVQDLQSRKMIVYQRDSAVTEVKTRLPFIEFALTGDPDRLFLYKTFKDGKLDRLAGVYNMATSEAETGSMPADPFYDGFDITFNSVHWLYHSARSVAFYKRFSSSIYSFDRESANLAKRLHIDTDYLPSDGLLQRVIKNKQLLHSPEEGLFIKDITNIFESDRYFFFDVHLNGANVKAFFDKEKRAFSYYKSIAKGVPSNNVLYGVTDKGSFIAAYYPNFADKGEFLKSLNVEEMNVEERKKMESISIEDNPLLLLIDYE